MNIPGEHGMDENDEEEMHIYANADPVNSQDVKTETENTGRHQPPQQTGSDSVMIRNYRAAVVCLVLLCVPLLTAVIVLCVHIHTNNTEDRDEPLTNITNLRKVRDQLLTRNTDLAKERDGLSSNNQELIKQRDQSNQEKNELLNSLREKDGWTYYRSHFYYISSETMSWYESRRYCTERGADLIIINNREERDFVKKLSWGTNIWIGLTDREVEGTWKWVDGSTPSSRFWESGEPNSYAGDEDCAIGSNSGWADYPCNHAFQWICEKSFLK